MHVEANALDVKPGDAHLVECGAWIVSDQSGLRQRLLQLNGFGPVFAFLMTCIPKASLTNWPTSLQPQDPNFFGSDWQDQPVVLETDVMTVGLPF